MLGVGEQQHWYSYYYYGGVVGFMEGISISGDGRNITPFPCGNGEISPVAVNHKSAGGGVECILSGDARFVRTVDIPEEGDPFWMTVLQILT